MQQKYYYEFFVRPNEILSVKSFGLALLDITGKEEIIDSVFIPDFLLMTSYADRAGARFFFLRVRQDISKF